MRYLGSRWLLSTELKINKTVFRNIWCWWLSETMPSLKIQINPWSLRSFVPTLMTKRTKGKIQLWNLIWNQVSNYFFKVFAHVVRPKQFFPLGFYLPQLNTEAQVDLSLHAVSCDWNSNEKFWDFILLPFSGCTSQKLFNFPGGSVTGVTSISVNILIISLTSSNFFGEKGIILFILLIFGLVSNLFSCKGVKPLTECVSTLSRSSIYISSRTVEFHPKIYQLDHPWV